MGSRPCSPRLALQRTRRTPTTPGAPRATGLGRYDRRARQNDAFAWWGPPRRGKRTFARSQCQRSLRRSASILRVSGMRRASSSGLPPACDSYFSGGPWYWKWSGSRPPREVVHRSPVDPDAARGLLLARRDPPPMWSRAPDPGGHLTHRGRIFFLARRARGHQGLPGLFRGGAGGRFDVLFPGPLLRPPGARDPPRPQILHPPAAAAGPRLLPEIRQQGGPGGALHPRPAFHDLLHRRDASSAAAGVPDLRLLGGGDHGPAAGLFRLVLRGSDRQGDPLRASHRARHFPGPLYRRRGRGGEGLAPPPEDPGGPRRVRRRGFSAVDQGAAAGSCCVMQCRVPRPQTRSTAWTPTTVRVGKRPASTSSASRSWGSLNVGTSTARLPM